MDAIIPDSFRADSVLGIAQAGPEGSSSGARPSAAEPCSGGAPLAKFQSAAMLLYRLSGACAVC
jgi:hypothetical protein